MTSTLVNTTSQELYQPYLALDMHYKVGGNNNITGKHQALEHLKKLEREGVLFIVSTSPSPDNRVDVMSYNGAQYAKALLGMSIYYRSTANPALLFNANTVHHDLIYIYCSLCGVQEKQAVPRKDIT